MKVLIMSSSRTDIDDYYTSIARSISNYLTQNNCDLVFGGCSNSMMGVCYDEFIKQDKKVYAYTTEKYKEDLMNLSEAECFICQTTFDLRKYMFENSDLIVCLPGGIGTYAELLSFIEEKRSNDKNIPIIIYDENGFYNKFQEIIKEQIKNGFTGVEILGYYTIAHNKQEFEDAFLNCVYTPKNR